MCKYLFFIGIDISKLWIDVCLTTTGQKAQMPHARFANDKKGFKEMLRFLKKNKVSPKQLKQCLFCMEHTGVYTLPLCRFLADKQLAFHLVSPHHLMWSLGLRRGKSDKADAADIARYIYLHKEEAEPSTLPSDKLLIIKNLLSLRSRLVNTHKGLKVAAKELQTFGTTATSKEVTMYTDNVLKPIKTSISSVERQLKQLIADDPELNRLHKLACSIKGVGLIISAHLLVYTVGFTAFANSRKFATYIGLAPFAQTSGTSVKVPAKVSHLAHKKLKGLISCGAACAMQHDKRLKAYYEQKLKEGKNKNSVQNAIRNKFVHIIFAVLKRGTPYVDLYQHIA